MELAVLKANQDSIVDLTHFVLNCRALRKAGTGIPIMEENVPPEKSKVLHLEPVKRPEICACAVAGP